MPFWEREIIRDLSPQVRKRLSHVRIHLHKEKDCHAIHQGRIARNDTKGEHLFLYSGLWASQIDGKVWLRGRGALISIDRRKREIQAWLGLGVQRRRLWLSQVVLPLCFIEILRARGCFYFHAACLRSPSGKVWLFTGNSGSGKTTLIQNLLKYGFSVLSDDAVVITRNRRSNRLHVFPFREFRKKDEIPRFARNDRGGDARNDRGGRSRNDGRRNTRNDISILSEAYGIDRIGVLNLRPERKTHLSPLSPSAALAQIIPSSPHVLSSKHDSLPHLNLLRKLVQDAKCFKLTLGRDAIKFPWRFAQRLNKV